MRKYLAIIIIILLSIYKHTRCATSMQKARTDENKHKILTRTQHIVEMATVVTIEYVHSYNNNDNFGTQQNLYRMGIYSVYIYYIECATLSNGNQLYYASIPWVPYETKASTRTNRRIAARRHIEVSQLPKRAPETIPPMATIWMKYLR